MARGGFRRCGGEQVLRLRAQAGVFRAPARVTFFFCKKKVTKENHSNLRFKDPLARGGQVQIWRYVLAGGVRWSSLSVKRTVPAFTGAEASATACPSHGRGICFYRVSDYQIAPIAARSTAMGRWRLTPPWYWGDTACGRDRRRKTPHPPRLRRATCLPAGRSVRGSDTPPACHSIPRTPQGEGFGGCATQGEGLGDKKKRPGALLLALFIAFWRCRSGPSGTGATGRRRGLRRGRRSWGPRWAAPRAGRSSNSRRRRPGSARHTASAALLLRC